MAKRFLALFISVMLIITCTAGCGGNKAFEDATKILEDRGTLAYPGSSEIEITYYEIASDNSYIIIDTNPYDIDDFYVAEANQLIKDANVTLGFSEALYEKMGQTRSMDGRQTEENDNFAVSWTYHPDKGLNVMYEKK